MSSLIDIPVFAGQGTSAASTAKTRQQALRDAASPNGSLLLQACFEAFHQELASLSPEDLARVDLDAADFKAPHSLLSSPTKRYQTNPLITGSTLFLTQTLRYIAYIESVGATSNSLTPFSDVLKRNLEHGLGVLGFSSGILPACVVGTSFSVIAFLTHAVETFRLVFWIGVRSQLFKASHAPEETTLPWSLVFMGLDKPSAEQAIDQFCKTTPTHSLYVTAVMNESSVTISGRPDILAAFSQTVTTGTAVKTNINTLYHAPIHASSAREEILADVARRGIRFPTLDDIKVPIRSSFTGQLIDQSTSGSLVELVVDMVLTQPVNWHLVVDALAQVLPEGDAPVRGRLLNVGPGAGLTRSMERAFRKVKATSFDISVAADVKAIDGTDSNQEPIAIVGLAVHMPGARNKDQLWEVLENGINTISEVPEHRFKVLDYNGPKNPKTKRQMKAHTGNFIDGADEFDNKFFKISPREAKSMDPQQRVLLHCAYEALENSGYVPYATPTTSPEDFGCYVGVATHDYIQNLRDDIDVYYSTGTLKAFLSGRISYAMQLSGPSIVVDTACSSSAVAVYQGCRALMNGDCKAALVGGVNVISSPDMMIGLDRGHFLSPTGQCKAFDNSADGYSRGEGCGIFVIKRLSDAIAENDQILGVIRGIEVNQSGLAHSITHPHASTQAALFKQVLYKAGLESQQVSLVEAHGTGTQAGDPNELESIRSIFGVARTPSNPLHITSVKANIGHLEAASGAAGLAKLLLMMKHRSIPRQISLKTLNPKINPLDDDHTIIHTTQASWNVPEGSSRIALLNNFGAAGSNTAMLVEEFKAPSCEETQAGVPLVCGLSAKTEGALKELKAHYADYLQSPSSSGIKFSDIAYTMSARRQLYQYRIAVQASSKKELAEKLDKAMITQAPGVSGRVVFVFSGQGGQYLGMGQSLYRTTPLFKKHVDECHRILTASGFPGVLPIINPGPHGSGLTKLEEFESYQTAIFTLQYALTQLWLSWGLVPAAVVGHSLGEYAALVTANVLSLNGALLIVASRVRFMVQKCAVDTTGMIAVNMGPGAVADILSSSSAFAGLSIACYNSEKDCVLSGPIEKLKELKTYLDANVGCKNVLLSVPFGYHSTAMQPLLQELILVAKQVTIRPPSIPVISNVLGELVQPGDASIFNADYFARHCAEPVQFEKGIRSLLANPEFNKVDAWMEIGPHTTTLPRLKSISAVPKEGLLLGSLRKQHEGWSTLSASLAQLFLYSMSIKWRQVFSHMPSVTCVDLPSYPFERAKFWVEFKEPSSAVAAIVDAPAAAKTLITDFAMLHSWVQHPSPDNGHVAKFETPINQLASSILGHSVGGMPLCPASVYLEQVFAGIELSKHHLGYPLSDSEPKLHGIEFALPLVYDEAVPRTVFTTITIEDGIGAFSVSSRIGSSSDESLHVRGKFVHQPRSKVTSKFSRRLLVLDRQITSLAKPRNGAPPQKFSTRTAYEVIFPRVVSYARDYHTMRSLLVTPSLMEGCADVKLPNDYDRSKFVAHPVFVDTLLHVAGFVANMHGEADDAYICSQVGKVQVLPSMLDYNTSYTVYCSNGWLADEKVMLAEAYAVSTIEPRQIVAHLKGMQFKRVRLSVLKKALARSVGHTRSAPTTAGGRTSTPVSKTSSHPNLAHRALPSSHTTDMDHQARIIKVLAETCDIASSSIKVASDLSALGVDSLMSIEIFGKLQATFPDANLDAHTLSSCQTVADIIQEVAIKAGSSSPTSKPTTPQMRPFGSASTPRIQALSGASTPRTPAISGASTPRTLVNDDQLADPPVLVVDGDIDVKQTLASVLDISPKDLADDSDFDSLGLDSLTSIEALHALKTGFGLDLPSDFFSNYRTARSVQTYLNFHSRARSKAPLPINPETIDSHIRSKTAEIGQTSLTRIAKALRLDTIPISIQHGRSSNHLPLFLIHDGSGLVNYYDRLSSLDRDIWGIHNPHFITSQPWDSVIRMGTAYADYIQSTSGGPVIVGGWSFGGVVAYEASLQLLKRGVSVKGLLLIDSPSPINHVPLSDALIDSVVNLDARAAASDLGRLVKNQFAMNSRLLGRYDPHATGGKCPPLTILRSSEGYNPPDVSDVPVWLADRTDPRLASAGWESLTTTPVKIFDIPGNHFQPFHPLNIQGVSAQIAAGCAHIESL